MTHLTEASNTFISCVISLTFDRIFTASLVATACRRFANVDEPTHLISSRKQLAYVKVGSNDSEVILPEMFCYNFNCYNGDVGNHTAFKAGQAQKVSGPPCIRLTVNFHRRIQFGEPDQQLGAAEGTFMSKSL